MQGRLLYSRVDGVESRFRFGGRVRADASGAPTSIDLGEVRIALGDGTHRYRHLDLRENVKFVTDDAGEVVAHYRYGPYGLDHVFGADEDPVRFVGRAEIGELVILGVRVYDPAVGRFLSPDPILQVENQHAYALGNPVLFTDPDGRQVEYGTWVGFTMASIALALSIFALMTLSTLSPGFIVFVTAAEFGLAGFEWANATARLIRSQEEKNDGEQSLAMLDGCSPARLTAVPETGGVFWLFAATQVLLALLVLRRRRRAAPGPEAS
jgi:RHS repeat-associated protein